jgi:hypothetical protein
VNEAFVRRFLDGADRVGRRLEIRGGRTSIAGVVRNSLYNAFGEPPTPIIYFSYRDRVSPRATCTSGRARRRDGAWPAICAASSASSIPELPLYDIRTLSDHIEANLIFRRIPARMFSVLAPLLLLLAAIGIYAVVAYAVSLRTRRSACAWRSARRRRRLVAQFVGEHLLVIGAGALCGWVVAFAVDRQHPVRADGRPRLRRRAGAADGRAALASWWPARRVTRVDPMLALRSE